MKYRECKYVLEEPFTEQTAIFPPRKLITEHVILTTDGWLFANKGFPFDGASGLAVDTPTNMRAAATHDALYYLMRCGLLDIKWRERADNELRRIMIERTRDNGWLGRTWGWLRAQYYYRAVRIFGESSARPQAEELETDE